MPTEDREVAMLRLARGLDASLHILPKIILLVQREMHPEFMKVNIAATLFVMAAKRVLEAAGWPEEKQIEFVTAAARTVSSHPEIPGTGVAVVGSEDTEVSN